MTHNKPSGHRLRRGMARVFGVPIQKLALALPFKLSILIDLGRTIEYSYWLRNEFIKPKFFRTRESLWSELLRNHVPEEIVVFEFGVAHGYTTQWWLNRINSKLNKWYGFDTFTGLPKAWGYENIHSFSNDGIPPRIHNEKLIWIIGLVENTFDKTFVLKYGGVQKLFIFDLDLYTPTRHILDQINSGLSNNDILFFDQASVLDERLPVEEFILSRFEVEYVGSTHNGLALKIIRPLLKE